MEACTPFGQNIYIYIYEPAQLLHQQKVFPMPTSYNRNLCAYMQIIKIENAMIPGKMVRKLHEHNFHCASNVFWSNKFCLQIFGWREKSQAHFHFTEFKNFCHEKAI